MRTLALAVLLPGSAGRAPAQTDSACPVIDTGSGDRQFLILGDIRDVPVISEVLLLVLILSHTYGYYKFVRIAFTAYAIFIEVVSRNEKSELNMWIVTFGLVEVLFESIIPVHLSRDIWILIDVTVSLLFFSWWLLRCGVKAKLISLFGFRV